MNVQERETLEIKNSVLNKIEKIVKKHTGREDLVLTLEMSIRDDLNMNSLDFAILICDLEDEFDCEISADKMQDFVNVQDVVDYIYKLEVIESEI